MEIKFNKNAVKYETQKAALIKIPRSKYKVWIPLSLIRHKYWFLRAFLPENMKFTLLKGRDTRLQCSAETLTELFEGIVLPTSSVEVYTPPEIKPKKVDVDESLKR